MTVMNEIAEKIVELISPVIGISLINEEDAKPPYCVYEIVNAIPSYSKEGIYKWTSEISIYVVAENDSAAAERKNSIINAMSQEVKKFKITLINTTPATSSGLWAYKIEYSIQQFI